MAKEKTDNGKQMAWLLSLAGWLPMAGIAIALYQLGPENALSQSLTEMFKTWSVVILSFLGGIRWGMAIVSRELNPLVLLGSIVASAVGWLSLLLPEPFCILVLLVAYCAQGAWDSFAIHSGGAEPWFGKLRIWLTMLVVAAHLLVILAIS